MNLEPDDLDWAMGELANLFAKANRMGILPHKLDPELFYNCWTILCLQSFEVATHCCQTLTSMLTAPLWQVSKTGYIKRIFCSSYSDEPMRYENTFTN